MRWTKKDLEKYVQAKEYIDTLLLPLVPVALGDDEEALKQAYQKEIMKIFANELEQELSGRLMLSPFYYYVKGEEKEGEITRLNQWIADVTKQPFKHIILLTFDVSWKKHEKELDGNLIWLPGMQTGDIQSKEMQQVMVDQIKQISEMIRSYW